LIDDADEKAERDKARPARGDNQTPLETPAKKSNPFGGIPEQDDDPGLNEPQNPPSPTPLSLPNVGRVGAQRENSRVGVQDPEIDDSPSRSQGPVFDDEVVRSQVPGRSNSGTNDSNGALPLARERASGLSSGSLDGVVSDPFVLPAERLSTGPNTAGLKVEVIAPEFANLNLESQVYIKVTNIGPADALGVVVRYPLPKDIEFIESEPVASRNAGSLILWQLNTIPKGSEKVIKAKVRPLAKGAFDHAVTVTMMTGGRARTMVRQAQLQVDIQASKLKPLKGEPVIFDVKVTNIGDHPASDVTLTAFLTPGLRHPEGQELKLSLKKELGINAIAAGESVPLKLEVDTIAMGTQSCELVAASRDLTEQVRKGATIEVVYPNLELSISGPVERYPDSLVTYTLTLKNSGSASARNVRIAASIPVEGKATDASPRPRWNAEQRRMDWSIAELHPDALETFTIQVRMGRVGNFELRAGAKYEGAPEQISATHTTAIRGIPKLQLSVSEPRGVLDEGEESTYEIRIRNEGSKEANALIVKGQVTPNLEVIGIEGPESKGSGSAPQEPQTAVFPQIDRLPPRGEITLLIRVRALRAGDATCQVTVGHADYQGKGGLSQTVITKVTEANQVIR
jgi:uncharacterized repeat protein (TIGR01451 family)